MAVIKVLLLCSSRFAIPALRDIFYSNQLALVGIPSHCSELLEEVQMLLTGSQVPVLELNQDNVEDELTAAIDKYNINLGFVLTFTFKISSSLYNSLPKGFFNVHPGPLPEYRGADPIFQQLKNREPKAGVTIHKLSEKMDAGDIVLRELIKADPRDTYGLLNNKLAELAAKLTAIISRMALFDIAIPSRAQDESRARYFKRQTSRDITINWEVMDAETIIALINACNPWNKGAVTKFNNKIIRILAASQINFEMFDLQKISPGIIMKITEYGMIVSTINGLFVNIDFIYTEEGFFNAARLGELGFFREGRFQPV